MRVLCGLLYMRIPARCNIQLSVMDSGQAGTAGSRELTLVYRVGKTKTDRGTAHTLLSFRHTKKLESTQQPMLRHSTQYDNSGFN